MDDRLVIGPAIAATITYMLFQKSKHRDTIAIGVGVGIFLWMKGLSKS
jgi:hypothetical protein